MNVVKIGMGWNRGEETLTLFVFGSLGGRIQHFQPPPKSNRYSGGIYEQTKNI